MSKNIKRGKDEYRKRFIDEIQQIEAVTGHRASEVLTMWLEVTFLIMSLAAAKLAYRTDILLEVDEQLKRSRQRFGGDKYDKVKGHAEAMLEAMQDYFEKYPCHDFIADVFMELAGSKEMGQFFTPQDVCQMMASLTMSDLSKKLEQKTHISIDEPAAGVGGMILAIANEMLEQGYNPQNQLYIRATELDRRAFHALYIQLNLNGLSASVRHGNTLSNEMFMTIPTLVLLKNPHLQPNSQAVKPDNVADNVADNNHVPSVTMTDDKGSKDVRVIVTLCDKKGKNHVTHFYGKTLAKTLKEARAFVALHADDYSSHSIEVAGQSSQGVLF